VVKRGFEGLQINILNHLVPVKITVLQIVEVTTVIQDSICLYFNSLSYIHNLQGG